MEESEIHKPQAVFLLHGSARRHTTRLMVEFLEVWDVFSRPSLSPSNYHLFTELKEVVEGKCHKNNVEVSCSELAKGRGAKDLQGANTQEWRLVRKPIL